MRSFRLKNEIARHWIVEDMIYLQAQTKSEEGVLESERQVNDNGIMIHVAYEYER